MELYPMGEKTNENQDSYSVVVVEDQEIMRRGLVEVLSASLSSSLSSKWLVMGEAANLTEAQNILKGLPVPPDLVLLDMALADEEWGLDLLPFLSERYKKSNMPPVLVYSIYTDYAHVKNALSMGVKGYVSKAKGLRELEAAMSAVVHGQMWVEQELISKLAIVPDLIKGLTKREQAVYTLAHRGWETTRIAKELGLAERSVENYLYRIYEKLGVKNRRELEGL
jgi:DNA-binding NarL/FixJ family response regulator